jgi:hypothetical protein
VTWPRPCLRSLARRAVEEYEPIVDSIVHSRSTEIRDIERTLDGLLDFCFDPEALLLYKKLCRHYDFIDLIATADYVRTYRAMWDSNPEVPGDDPSYGPANEDARH